MPHFAVHGWSPASAGDDGEDVEVELESASLARVAMAPSSDRRTQRNRSRDPTWIPRPRNAFIIFRCEYSRQHTQPRALGTDNDDDADADTPNPTAKTLSKRAAEAWKQLSMSEKERYKALADKEREQHARLYPHYRFRPMRRQQTRPHQTQLGEAVVVVPLPGQSLASQVPSVLAPSGRAGDLSSSSVPSSSSSPLPVPPSIVPSQHCADTRHTMSMVPSSPPWHATAPPLIDIDDTQTEATEVVDYAGAPSPLATVTSSLVAWNGASGAPVQTHTQGRIQAQVQGTCRYGPAASPGVGMDMDAETSSSAFTLDVFSGSQSSQSSSSSSTSTSYQDLERAQALEAYAIGLYGYGYGYDGYDVVSTSTCSPFVDDGDGGRVRDSGCTMGEDVWWGCQWSSLSPWSGCEVQPVFGVE